MVKLCVSRPLYLNISKNGTCSMPHSATTDDILDILCGKDPGSLEREWLYCNQAAFGGSETYRKMPYMYDPKRRRSTDHFGQFKSWQPDLSCSLSGHIRTTHVDLLCSRAYMQICSEQLCCWNRNSQKGIYTFLDYFDNGENRAREPVRRELDDREITGKW